jgi:uncharacterized protein YbcV (DUF1398 family)
MSSAIENLKSAQKRAMSVRPKVGGFPYLAEALREAGVTKNIWNLPTCQSLYLTKQGPVVEPSMKLIETTADVPRFDRDALIKALRVDQAGESTFPDFLKATWKAGIVRYEVDFEHRKVIYYGCNEESYTEDYPAVELT